jgi:xanthine dehydrogenase accessory factor
MLTPEFLNEIDKLHAAGRPFCTVRIVDGSGSIPQIVGAHAVFAEDGLCFGTVGGGRLEAACQEKALALMADAGTRHRFERLNLQKDIGMTCGGEVAVFFEVYHPALAWHVVVFGAGHVAQKLCRFLAELDCRVTCIDTRTDWLEKLPVGDGLETRHVAHYSDGVDQVGTDSYVIIMTMGHQSDVPVLRAIEHAQPEIPYLGVIGSDSKARVLRKDLLAAGVSPAFIDRVVCPIGDKVGNNTPAEIAFSAVAQLLKHRRGPEIEERQRTRGKRAPAAAPETREL